MADQIKLKYGSIKPGSNDGKNSAWSWTLYPSSYLARPNNFSKYSKGKHKLVSVTLALTRVKNAQRAIKMINQGGATIAKGQVKSSNIKVHLEVGSKKSNTQTITAGPTELQGTGGNSYYSDIYSWAPASKTYTFKFSDKIKITTGTKVKIVIDGCSGNTGGISVGWTDAWADDYWTIEKIDDEPQPEPAPDPPPEPGTREPNVYLTNTTGDLTEPHASGDTGGGSNIDSYNDNKIRRDYIMRALLGDAGFWQGNEWVSNKGSGSYVSIAETESNNVVLVTAKSSNTNYPTYERVPVTTRSRTWIPTEIGGYYVYYSDVTNVLVRFYEMIEREDRTEAILVNARDAVTTDIDITEYNYGSSAAKAHNAWKNVSEGNVIIPAPSNQQDLDTFTIEDNISIPISQYFTLASNSSNIHKITDDYQYIPYLFRFYNSDVRGKNVNVINGHKSYVNNLNVNLQIRCAPNDSSQFSYEFWDRYNNVVAEDNLPEIFLIDQEEIMVANMRYENSTAEGGYCRAFRITFRDYNTKATYVTYNLRSEQDFAGTWSPKIMEHKDSHYNQLPYGVIMELVIEPYFYFDDSFNTAYTDCMIVIPQLFLKQEDWDVIPKLFFPVLSDSAPWTPMMLPSTERYGYYFETIISDNWKKFKTKFGINIGGYDLFLEEEEYWSNRDVVRHMILNMGKFVSDNSMYDEALFVRPFIITMYDTPQAWRDYYDTINSDHTDTSKDSMWLRPIAKSGEYLRYYDFDRFMKFINKYKPLNNNIDWIVPSHPTLCGYLIDTDFWIQKVTQANANYVRSMESWVADSGKSGMTNTKPCWIDTKFLHKKGEHIMVKGTKTTHDFLHESKYTHDYLHQFTHDYIQNRIASVNNLKENYYDILICLDYYNEVEHNY